MKNQSNGQKAVKKALNKIDVLEKPTEYNADMRLSIEPEIISGNDVLTLKDVSNLLETNHYSMD